MGFFGLLVTEQPLDQALFFFLFIDRGGGGGLRGRNLLDRNRLASNWLAGRRPIGRIAVSIGIRISIAAIRRGAVRISRCAIGLTLIGLALRNRLGGDDLIGTVGLEPDIPAVGGNHRLVGSRRHGYKGEGESEGWKKNINFQGVTPKNPLHTGTNRDRPRGLEPIAQPGLAQGESGSAKTAQRKVLESSRAKRRIGVSLPSLT